MVGEGLIKGFAFSMVFLLIIITLFALVEPFKEQLDNNRDSTGANTGLNCPNTPSFNQTSYDDDSSFEKLVRRPTCFVTGISMVWFVVTVFLSASIWLYSKWTQ